jgi:hypothetical protein
VIEDAFQVLGFSVRGRVVDRAGKGLEGVTINVNSIDKATSDKDGYYRLDQITINKYVIKAHKPHVFFHTLKNIQLSPTVTVLPDITVTHYHLCGSVNTGESGIAPQGRTISLAGQQVNLQTFVSVLALFIFCFLCNSALLVAFSSYFLLFPSFPYPLKKKKRVSSSCCCDDSPLSFATRWTDLH